MLSYFKIFFSFCELEFIFCFVFFLFELSAVLVRELLVFWLFHFFYSHEKCFQSPLFSLVLTYPHPPYTKLLALPPTENQDMRASPASCNSLVEGPWSTHISSVPPCFYLENGRKYNFPAFFIQFSGEKNM